MLFSRIVFTTFTGTSTISSFAHWEIRSSSTTELCHAARHTPLEASISATPPSKSPTCSRPRHCRPRSSLPCLPSLFSCFFSAGKHCESVGLTPLCLSLIVKLRHHNIDDLLVNGDEHPVHALWRPLNFNVILHDVRHGHIENTLQDVLPDTRSWSCNITSISALACGTRSAPLSTTTCW